MGHWESNHRKHGYAEIVLKAAVSDSCLRRAKVTQEENTFTSSISGVMISYIVDSNDASRSLYQKLGWKRVADADWVGFCLEEQEDIVNNVNISLWSYGLLTAAMAATLGTCSTCRYELNIASGPWASTSPVT